MLNRKDPVLVVEPETELAHRTIGDKVWRCLRIRPHGSPQIIIRDIMRWHPFYTCPESVGWYATMLNADSGSLLIRVVERDRTLTEKSISFGKEPELIEFRWPLAESIGVESSLQLHFQLDDNSIADMLIHKRMDRSDLLALAKGRGVEIGPGSNPQVVDAPGVDVQYIEEMPAERWRELYDGDNKYQSKRIDWSKYVVGKASDLPVDDSSIDFIFSSHVFEHLANPLGHLDRWSKKLRSGGVVLAVIPDIDGTKDFRHTPCSLQEIIREYEIGEWEPTRRHYERWASTRGGWSNRVDEAMLEKRSIHVHFYTRESIADLLRYATQSLNYSGYCIRHTPNHRDFYWTLTKA